MNRDDITPTCWIDFGKLTGDIAFTDQEFEDLWNMHPLHLGTIKMFGKDIETPRYQQSYLQSYAFSGLKHVADPNIHPTVVRLLNWANTLGYGKFNQCFINWYQNGEHYIGPHSDNEKQLVKDTPIFSCSLGATRTFEITESKSKKLIKSYKMENNSFLVMGGNLQKLYKHGVPKITPLSLAKQTGRRINITFRVFSTNIPPEMQHVLDNITTQLNQKANNTSNNATNINIPPKKLILFKKPTKNTD